MPLDRHARRFLEMLAAAGQSRGRYEDAGERRQALISLADLVDPPGTVAVGGTRDMLFSVDDGVIVLRTFSPAGKPERVLPGIVFLHGGGWVAGLAAAICRLARDASGPKLAFQLLICPILDVAAEAASRLELADGYFLDRETLLRDLELYCAPDMRADPRLSPLLADDLAGLPRAFIHTGQFDPFGDEGEAYAAKLSQAGVKVQGRTHPGMIHYFYCMPRMIPYAHEAMHQIGAEIRYAVQLPADDRRSQRRTRPELIRA